MRARLGCVLLASMLACGRSEASPPLPDASGSGARAPGSGAQAASAEPGADTCPPLRFDLPEDVVIPDLDPPRVDVDDTHGSLERF
ncbi:MAG TPA: hypothetical protein VHS09_07535, partial [Polyangiaceae bacterium]|nr:hypothetical protein [Polyangiaceae bacterium]